MNKILSKITDFEIYVCVLFYKLERFLFPKNNRVQKIENKTKERIDYYNGLISDYNKIMEKTSTLSKANRDKVVTEVEFLISKGHISVGQSVQEQPKESNLKIV